MEALFQNGETFQNNLENYPAAIEAYDELLRRFGTTAFKRKEEGTEPVKDAPPTELELLTDIRDLLVERK